MAKVTQITRKDGSIHYAPANAFSSQKQLMREFDEIADVKLIDESETDNSQKQKTKPEKAVSAINDVNEELEKLKQELAEKQAEIEKLKKKK